MSKIKLTILPNYSTERFYLLSELEEICLSMTSIYNEEENENNSTIIETEKYWNNIKLKDNENVLIYVLWREESGIDKLINSIELVLGGLSFNEELRKKEIKRIIAVEILLSNQGSWSNELHSFLSETLNHISLKYYAIHYIFGIADNFATPALEALLKIALQLKKDEQICRMIVAKSDDYLGHNKNAEPDAISGVFQCLLQLNNSKIISSEKRKGRENQNNNDNDNHEEDDDENENNNNNDGREGIKNKQSLSSTKFDLIRSQGIIFLIVALFSWIIYNYLNKKN